MELEARRKGGESQEEGVTKEPRRNKPRRQKFRGGSGGACVKCGQTHIKEQLQ